MNLPHDALDIAVGIEVVGSDFEHVVASNGDVVQVAEHAWRVEFPSDYTSMSPLLVLQPEQLTRRGSAEVDLPEGGQVTVDVVVRLGHIEAVADLLAETGEAIIYADLELGDYTHGERFLVHAGGGGSGGMEYAGAKAAWLDYIRHEVFHSWIGRGLAPVDRADCP